MSARPPVAGVGARSVLSGGRRGREPPPRIDDIESEDESEDDVDFVRRVVKPEAGASGDKLVSMRGRPRLVQTRARMRAGECQAMCACAYTRSLSRAAKDLSLFVAASFPFPHYRQPTEMACLDYVPSTAIRPVDLAESLRPIKAQRKIRLLIGALRPMGHACTRLHTRALSMRACTMTTSHPLACRHHVLQRERR